MRSTTALLRLRQGRRSQALFAQSSCSSCGSQDIYFDSAEKDGFRSAGKKFGIHTLEMVSVRDSLVRLFRDGKYPPLCGTTMGLDDGTSIIYARGSVEFFSTYPGMYVP